MKIEEPLSVRLHAEAQALRNEAAMLAATYRPGITFGELAELADLAKALRAKAGIVLRRARAAAKREGRTP